MFPYLIAAVRPTETWAPHHFIAVLVVAAGTVWLVRRIRVGGRG